jgi:hypothetical protein
MCTGALLGEGFGGEGAKTHDTLRFEFMCVVHGGVLLHEYCNTVTPFSPPISSPRHTHAHAHVYGQSYRATERAKGRDRREGERERERERGRESASASAAFALAYINPADARKIPPGVGLKR